MSTIKKFEDIEAWQLARRLCKSINTITNEGAFKKDFGLKDQIRRSSGSIMDNIAEGFDRDGNKEFRQFLSYSKGSAAEVKSQLYRAMDNKYITEDAFNELCAMLDLIGGKITNLIKYLSSTERKGLKYL